MIYKQITLNPWEPPLGEIRVIQEEADGRDLIINLIDDTGSPLDLTGKTVSVYIQKPDNTMIYNSCEVEGNQATVTLTLQMMAVSGDVYKRQAIRWLDLYRCATAFWRITTSTLPAGLWK